MLCYFRVLVMIVYYTAYMKCLFERDAVLYIYDITGGQFNIQLSVLLTEKIEPQRSPNTDN